MDYYCVCSGCNREWWFSQGEVNGNDYMYCSECGEEIPVQDMSSEENLEMPLF